MKTERRHDLETNELARRATVWIEKVKPYSNQIFGVVVVLLGLWVVSTVWGSLSTSQDEAAWDAYGLALTSNDLEMLTMQRIADEDLHGGTTMQEWAYAAWADRQLFLATRQYLVDRTASQERLRRIVGIYEQLSTNGHNSQLRNRARFGLARVYELQNKLEEAREQYDQVQGDLQPLARMYADRLLTPEAQESYAWLSTTELPRRSTGGGLGTPGNRPLFDAELPNAGDSTGINLRTLEDILGIPSDTSVEDRYQKDAEPAEQSEKSDDESADGESADAGVGGVDAILGEEEPVDETTPEDAN